MKLPKALKRYYQNSHADKRIRLCRACWYNMYAFRVVDGKYLDCKEREVELSNEDINAEDWKLIK